MHQIFNRLKLTFVSLKSIMVASLLVFFSSCKEKDPETEQTCVYAGKLSTLSTPTSLSTFGNEVALNDQNQLTSARKWNDSEVFSNSKTRLWKRSFTDDYVPQYNSEGFLTQMVLIKKDIYEGTVGNSFQYNGQSFLNFKTETIQTSDYKYESGHISSISTKSVTRMQGDNATPIVSESSFTKVYTYDSQGNPVSALTSAGTVIAFKNGIIASETLKDVNGVIISQNLYNEKGLQTSIASNNFRYEKEYDAKGNLISVRSIQNGQLNFLQEYLYDDHKNPETDIPVKFKGIPENIITVQITESVNNRVIEKFTSYAGGVNYENPSVYQYNAAGLPESVGPPKDPADGQNWKVTFRYQCQ